MFNYTHYIYLDCIYFHPNMYTCMYVPIPMAPTGLRKTSTWPNSVKKRRSGAHPGGFHWLPTNPWQNILLNLNRNSFIRMHFRYSFCEDMRRAATK